MALAAVVSLSATAAVDLRVEPGRERLRPYESARLELRLSGNDRAGGQALPEGLSFRLREDDGGWLSRPYRVAGDEAIGVLYTAPSRPGRYAVEARLRSARLEVEMGSARPPPRTAPPNRSPSAAKMRRATFTATWPSAMRR
jgi:hypothetical protein